jgi:hypothetical protein
MTGQKSKSRLSPKGRWGVVNLAIGLCLLAAVAALPYIWYSVTTGVLAETNSELRLLDARLSTSTGTRQAALSAEENIDGMFIEGTTPGLALAALRRLVGSVAQENGLVLQRVQPLQSEDRDGLTVLRMEVETTGSLESLRGYLLAIETGLPLIHVNAAKILAPANVGETGSELPSDNLTVALQLESYGWRDTKP